MREVPDALHDAQNPNIGAVIAGWEAFISDGAVTFPDLPGAELNFCLGFDGNATGSLLFGDLLWSIGPPKPDLLPNQVYLTMTQDRKTNYSFSLAYSDGVATMIPSDYAVPGATTERLFDEPMEFQVTDSLSCDG